MKSPLDRIWLTIFTMGSMLQDYGGAVVVGNNVQASFESCSFLDNGRPLCAEQDFTLVCALT